MAENNPKMTQKTIQNQLDSIISMNAMLNTLISKTNNDNSNLKLGDQLRPTNDYNGSLFEVVREPYNCWVTPEGKAVAIQVRSDYQEFDSEEAALEFYNRIQAKQVDAESHDDGYLTIKILVRLWRDYPQREREWVGYDTPVYSLQQWKDEIEDGYDSDEDFTDMMGQTFYNKIKYEVHYTHRETPEDFTIETRVWLRKICIISKAEGQSDDKNSRSLPFALCQMPFGDLIRTQIQKLNKISRSLEDTPKTAKRTKKITMADKNRAKLAELEKVWLCPDLIHKPVEGFYSEKYGMFLKSDVKFEVSQTAVNPVQQLAKTALEMEKAVSNTVELRKEVMTELKSTTN